jgi:hypothetical protein
MTRRLVTALAASIVAYAALEACVRSLRLPEADLLDHIEVRLAEARGADGTIRAPASAKAVYGWDSNEELRWNTGTCRTDECKSVLFVGDSVTRGFGVDVDTQSFPAILAEEVCRPRGFSTINAATQGFGLDQMVLKLEHIAPSLRPAVIVLAYIPHDLWRIARDVNYGITKPVLLPAHGGWSLREKTDQAEFLRSYERADRYYLRAPWVIRHVLVNRRYYAAALYEDYYRATYRALAGALARLVEELEVPLLVVRLPSTWPGAPLARLDRFATEVFITGEKDAGYRFSDLERCVRLGAAHAGIDVDSALRWHPGPREHAIIARCLSPELSAALDRAR